MLSTRENDVLACLARGDSEKQVALALGISRHTVHVYVKSIYRKLRVESRGELMAIMLVFVRAMGRADGLSADDRRKV